MAEIKIEQFNFLKANRKYLRSKITRKCNEFKSNLNNLDHKTCTDCLSELKCLLEKVDISNQHVSNAIWQHVTERSLLDKELEEIDQYDDKLRSTIRLIEDKLSSIQSSVQAREDPIGSNRHGEALNPAIRLRLPEVPLPTFSNNEGEN